MRFASTLPPTLAGSSDAPITTTLVASKITRSSGRGGGPHHDDGTGRRPDHLVRHAAEHEATEPAVAVRADHDVVGLLARRGRDDLLVRYPGAPDPARRHT